MPQVGYDPSCYAPNAVIAAVDIDPEEFHKVQSFIDVPVLSSVADFLSACAEGEHYCGMSQGGSTSSLPNRFQVRSKTTG